MLYKGLEIEEGTDFIKIDGIRDFDAVHTFECGQCFRWIRETDGSYTGVVKNRVGNVKFQDGLMTIGNSNIKDFQDIWYDYLDLGRDYSAIKKELVKDEIMEKAVAFGHGIRILKQDVWEALISFIISANNRIPMIMKVVAAISHIYGEELMADGKSYYAFPGVDKLKCACLEELEVCRGGFRCKYILNTAGKVAKGVVDLDKLDELDTDDARELLTRLPGVGNKVADCTLLYSGAKYDVFPTDVWVKRVMEELYLKREASFKEIRAFAQEYFGNLAGFAQQYLFYYARENRIGVGG